MGSMYRFLASLLLHNATEQLTDQQYALSVTYLFVETEEIYILMPIPKKKTFQFDFFIFNTENHLYKCPYEQSLFFKCIPIAIQQDQTKMSQFIMARKISTL